MGKLDTVTVNGPEGDVVDWDAVDWRAVEGDVRRLRQRILGDAGGGSEEGPQSAEADAPLPRERSAERAASDGAHALPAPPARRLCRCTSTLQPRLTPSGLA